jgi:hypothetical protein
VKSISLLLLGVVCAEAYGGLCVAQEVTSSGFGGSRAQQAQRKVQGKVVQGDGQGIRKVKVTLTGPQQYSAITDENGQFTVEGVEAGAYMVQLERSGYAPDQKAGRERQVKVVAEQDAVDLTFHMVTAGVLSGKVVDADGDPLRNFSVDATTSSGEPISVRRAPSRLQGGITNDLGEYRIPDVPPGKYFVQATPQENEAPPPSPGQKENPKERLAYIATYYPGTLDKQQAAVVEVLAGGTATADISVQTSRVYRVSGNVVGLNWPPPAKPSGGESENPIAMAFAGMGQILLIAKTGQMKELRFAQDGRFEFTNVLPGTYQAQVIVFSMTGPAPSVKMQRIRTPIEVNGSDVDGLQLRLDTGGDVSGKFRMDDNAKMDWNGLRVALMDVPEPGAEEPKLEVMRSGGVAMVKQDGSFEIKDAAAGEYQLHVGASSDKYRDYYTKSVLLRGQEVADTGFTVSPGTVLDVVISAKGGAIEGTVVDGAGKPVAETTVVAVPNSGKLARPDAYQSGQTDEKGHFELRGMNPGQFVVLAFQEMQGDYRSPEFAKKYESQGEKVELDEGVKKSVVVKVIEGP